MIALLALDTSAGSTGVAVAVDGEVLASSTVIKPYGHSDTLFAQIDDALRRAGLAREALSAVAVTRGPGSFTGLRVGVATAKGIAFALGIPTVGISSLQALAAAGRGFSGMVVPLLDARKGQVYGAVYDGQAWEAVVGEGAWMPEELARAVAGLEGDVLALGSGVGPYEEIFRRILGDRLTVATPERWNVDPAQVALLGHRAFLDRLAVPPERLAPVYHRISEAEEKRLRAAP